MFDLLEKEFGNTLYDFSNNLLDFEENKCITLCDMGSLNLNMLHSYYLNQKIFWNKEKES
jgi:hypothetical protein